jgi:demethylmenaquinone methyltransferase/2-methoxy-6-polyprenyl-1,4-benzoquinol methylase
MFSTVAPRYDLITRLFSYGMDRGWKRLAVDRAHLPERAVVLDLACGTGDFSKIVAGRRPAARAVAADLTQPMLRLARSEGIGEAVCADAMALPFADGSFDCVFVGYGLRNFPDLSAALNEIRRVTRPGGRLVSLDFYLPARPVFRRLFLAYLYAQGALWGMLLHRRPSVYTYIPDSLRCYLSKDGLSDLLASSGFGDVEARGFILDGIAVHWASRV